MSPRCDSTVAFAVFVAVSGCDEGYTPFYIRAYIPDQVTTDGLLSLKQGMTYSDIEKLIGAPVCWEVEDADAVAGRAIRCVFC